MKVLNALMLGLSALGLSRSLAQECPAGYSMSVSYITVTATAEPEPEPTAPPTPTDECPAGSSLVVSYVTVTATEADLAIAGEPTTTIHTTSTTTATTTVAATDKAAAPVNAVENSVQVQASTAVAAASPAASSTSASTSSLGSSLSGEATFYDGNVAGGACSFTHYTLPAGIFGTALSQSNWDSAGNCGACVSVTGPSGNSITAMIVDLCPGCGLNHLDLFQDAFSTLADTSLGVIDITWEYVTCPISSPLELSNKEGASSYWFSMQVVNANAPVDSLEVSTDGGATWQGTTRTAYNFFQHTSGFGTSSVDVKVTSSTGKSITVNDVPVADGSSTTAASNF